MNYVNALSLEKQFRLFGELNHYPMFSFDFPWDVDPEIFDKLRNVVPDYPRKFGMHFSLGERDTAITGASCLLACTALMLSAPHHKTWGDRYVFTGGVDEEGKTIPVDGLDAKLTAVSSDQTVVMPAQSRPEQLYPHVVVVHNMFDLATEWERYVR